MKSRRIFLQNSLAAMAAFSIRAMAQPTPFILTIARKFSSDICMSGYFAVNGDIICYTLELPWKNNKPYLSSVPVGDYAAIVRYDHPDKWRIQLDVPGRPLIQIHTGNAPADSQGCILVGMKLNNDLCSITGGTSKEAYDKLRIAFYGSVNPTATPNKNIRVQIEE